LSLLRRACAASALIAFGSLLALAMTEAALRLYDATKPKPPIPRADLWDPKLGYGWLHPPGIEGAWFDDHGEFSVVVKINSHGLRDVEHEYAKPPGVFRILLLGDSYMEAVQVQLEQIFPRLLEQMLHAGGRRVEVINASAADWGTDNELVYLREEGFKYSPDLVLLAFTTANDVRNNSVVLNLRVPTPNPYKPTFTMNTQGALEFHPMPSLPPSLPPPPWWQHVRVATFFVNRLGHRFGIGAPPPLPPAAAPPDAAALASLPAIPPAAAAAPAGAAPAAAPPSIPAATTPVVPNVPTDMLVYASPPLPEVVGAWAVTKALILELKAEAQRRGAAFAMFSVNGPWAHYDEYWQLMTMKDPTVRKTWNRRAPSDEFARFCTEKGIPCLDTFEEFEAKKAADPLYFRFDPHWTPAGHRLAADTVARFLIDSRLVPQSR